MSLELLSKNDYNIISIDWMIGATPPYTQAVANARLVGAIVAHFFKSIQVIDWLIQLSIKSMFDLNHIMTDCWSLNQTLIGYCCLL